MGVSVLDWPCSPGPVKCVRVCIRVCNSHSEVHVTFLAHMCVSGQRVFLLSSDPPRHSSEKTLN